MTSRYKTKEKRHDIGTIDGKWINASTRLDVNPEGNILLTTNLIVGRVKTGVAHGRIGKAVIE